MKTVEAAAALLTFDMAGCPAVDAATSMELVDELRSGSDATLTTTTGDWTVINPGITTSANACCVIPVPPPSRILYGLAPNSVRHNSC